MCKVDIRQTIQFKIDPPPSPSKIGVQFKKTKLPELLLQLDLTKLFTPAMVSASKK